MVGFPGGDIYTAISHRGEPFDLAIGVGWCEDYHDPLSFMQLIDGSTIHDGDFNNNWSCFNDAGINARLNAATQLVGQPRYDAFGQIDVDAARDFAPVAAWGLYQYRELVSSRVGCELYDSNHGLDLAALCTRPEIVVDDVSVDKPAAGIATATFTVRLGSELDNPVSVDFATADGTAHAGTDYAAIFSGTLTFAAHERTPAARPRASPWMPARPGAAQLTAVLPTIWATRAWEPSSRGGAPGRSTLVPHRRLRPRLRHLRRRRRLRLLRRRLLRRRRRLRRSSRRSASCRTCSARRWASPRPGSRRGTAGPAHVTFRKTVATRRGRVLAESPRPGKRLANGARVNLIVGRGRCARRRSKLPAP